MKFPLITTTILLLLLPVIFTAQTPTYPPLEEVVTTFFTRYDFPEGDNPYLHFERRPNGYFVSVIKQEDFSLQKREQFYRFAGKAYNDLKLYKKGDEENAPTRANKWLDNHAYDAGLFAQVPFYGYDGWYKDVIALYENAPNPGDWELNALARAHQVASSNLLYDLSGYGDPADQFDLPPGQQALTQAQVEQYLAATRKELQTYDRLRKQNPDFLTTVGPVNIKYGDEVMDAFLTLLYYQDETTARQVLEPGLFDPYILQSARNLLHSCPPDAVLFTYGDNDTYPVYYVQAVENLRTDVIIANLSLLVLPRYLSMVYSGPMAAKPLQTGLPDLYFREMIMWEKTPPEAKDRPATGAEPFFAAMADTSRYKPGYLGQYRTYPLETDGIVIDVPADAARLGADPVEKVQWNAEDHYYFPDKTAPLDMVVANHWSRPLCFSLSCRSDVWTAWNPHLAMEGLVYRLYPDELEPVKQMGEGVVNTDTAYRLWTEVFQFETTTPITQDKMPFHQINFVAGLKLAQALMEKAEMEKALTVARSLPQRLPNAVKPWDYTWLEVVKLLGALGDADLGETIGHVLLTNYESELEAPFDASKRLFVKEVLTDFANEYGKRGLKQRCRKF